MFCLLFLDRFRVCFTVAVAEGDVPATRDVFEYATDFTCVDFDFTCLDVVLNRDGIVVVLFSGGSSCGIGDLADIVVVAKDDSGLFVAFVVLATIPVIVVVATAVDGIFFGFCFCFCFWVCFRFRFSFGVGVGFVAVDVAVVGVDTNEVFTVVVETIFVVGGS